MSQLVKKIEAFLILQYQQQFSLQRSKYLAQIYQEKNLPKQAEKIFTKHLISTGKKSS